MTLRLRCDFDTGDNGKKRRDHTCGQPAVYRIHRTDHEGKAERFDRCTMHTETIAKGFANTVDELRPPRRFEAVRLEGM